jgi:hypothetical protein
MLRKKEGNPPNTPRVPEDTPALPPPDNPRLRQDAEDAAHGRSGLTEAEMARRRARAIEESRKLPPDPASESNK